MSYVNNRYLIRPWLHYTYQLAGESLCPSFNHSVSAFLIISTVVVMQTCLALATVMAAADPDASFNFERNLLL
jgi:hypothetical protein